MCGIAGIIYYNQKAEHSVIQKMTDSLAHRGPDGDGFFVHQNLAFGHRRLAIIDLEGGKQPLSNEDQTVWITFNGEIYNFLELKNELISRGHIFKTHSDTEAIVHAYEEWGENCVKKLRGMFAFAIADIKNNKVFVARDQAGIKPLYYIQTNTFFAFASELQALRMIPNSPLSVDLKAIDDYLYLQYIPAPRTIFKEIKKLFPAHCFTTSFDLKQHIEPKRFWQFDFKPNLQLTENEWLEGLDSILRDSVKAHLLADVPFGAFLSGGVDSSAVVAYMSQILDKPVKTFSIGFEEDAYNELPFAQQAAKICKTEHHVEIVKPNGLAILPDLVKHYGEPFGDSSAIPTYYVSQMARKHVTMVLTGDGGDEIFGGYHTYTAYWSQYSHYPIYPEWHKGWKKAIYPMLNSILPKKFPLQDIHLKMWLDFIQYSSPDWRKRLWKNDFRNIVEKPLELFEKYFEQTKAFTHFNKVQYMDIHTYLPFDILTKVDVASMMNSLETRTPIIDWKVMEFAAQIPEKYNIRQENGQWIGKSLLKKLMEKYYPKEFIYRQKQGFSIPAHQWFGNEGEFRKNLESRMNSEEFALKNIFDKQTIKEMITQNMAPQLWTILFLEEWFRQNNIKI